MKIRGFELFQVPPRWLFLRIDTDEGICGWGEPVLEGRAEVVAAAVSRLMEHLVGADPGPIEDHWQVLTKGGFYRGGPVLGSAVAGIDQALWDIVGKMRGAPVHELLGGPVRQTARVYGWIGGDEPRRLEDAAAELVRSGLTAVKFNLSGRLEAIDRPSQVTACVDRVAAVRHAIGPDRDLVVDFHGRVSTAMARRILPLLEPLYPLFVEEPVLPEFSNRLPEIVAATSVPIATGERLYSRWDFRDVIRSGVAVVQPDPSHAHGISEVRRIAALAETYDVQLAPHLPAGTGRARRGPPDRVRDPQLPDPGTEPRDALQLRWRPARLRGRYLAPPHRGRSDPPPHRTGARSRNRRARGATGGAEGVPNRVPGLAAYGRLVR